MVSDERPCSMKSVTFTCTAPGSSLRWSTSDAPNINVNSGFTPLNIPLMPIPPYTVILTAFNDTSLTSTLSRIAENGVIVTCLDPPNDVIGATTIQLTGEVYTLIITRCVFYLYNTVTPSLPQGVRHFVERSSTNTVRLSVQWDPSTDTGGRLTYTVTISPPVQLSATFLTSTSVTVTAQYNVDYTISIMATNCAGNSTTAEYNFRTGELSTYYVK